MSHKKRLGILSESCDDYNMEMIRGAQAAAKENNAELVIFTGSGTTRRKGFDAILNKHNMAYSFANYVGIDQLLISVSNLIISSQMGYSTFLKDYRVPLVTINYQDDQYRSVAYDNVTGVKDAISYLIHSGHRKRIAFIGGPRQRSGTAQRLAVYKQVLEENNLPFDESLLCFCPNYTSFNHELIEPFYLQKRDRIDAFFCCTDKLAMCVYDVLKKHHITIGDEILITSFDDDPQSCYMIPPLATVHADAALMTYIAGTMAFSDTKDFHIKVPTNFIIRRSAGAAFSKDDYLKTFIETSLQENRSVHEIAEGVMIYFFDDKIVFDLDFKELVASFFETILNIRPGFPRHPHDFFMSFLSRIITYENLKFIDIDKLVSTLSLVIEVMCEHNPGNASFYREIQDYLYNQVIFCYSTMATQINFDNTEQKIAANLISRITIGLSPQQSTYEMFAEVLQISKIHNAMLLTFPQVLQFTRFTDYELPSMLFLKAQLRNGKIIPPMNNFYGIDDVLDYFPGDYKTFSMIAFNENQYGILITDTPYEQLSELEFLVSQFGTVLYLSKIVEKLNMQSFTDELTGVYNRRGIIDKLNEVVSTLRHDEYAYILFADLDHLKYINDQYGHEAGDKAIRMCAETLTTAFPRDLVGRIGGDEFIVVIKTRHPEFIKTVDQKIESTEAFLRDKYQYAFYTSLSYGMSVFDHDSSTKDIQRIIDNADTFMYECKKRHHEMFDAAMKKGQSQS